MGQLSDFVVADTVKAVNIGKSVQPSKNCPTLEGWKGIETIKLSTLYCIISGEAYSNELNTSFKLLGGDKEEGPKRRAG